MRLLCQLLTVSVVMEGCMSLYQDLHISPKGPLSRRPTESGLLDFLANAASSEHSPRDVGLSKRLEEETPESELSKRGNNKEQAINRLLEDIESALLFLEEENRRDAEDHDKRRPRQQGGRRHHNFVRIGKRDRKCSYLRCTSLHRRPSGSKDDDKLIRHGKDAIDRFDYAGTHLIPYVWPANTGYGQRWAEASHHDTENHLNDFYPQTLEDKIWGYRSPPTKRRNHRFVRFGRQSNIATQMPEFFIGDVEDASLSLEKDTQFPERLNTAKTPSKKDVFHKFVRFGRSTRASQHKGYRKPPARSDDVQNRIPGLTSSPDRDSVVNGKSHSLGSFDLKQNV
ncbi:hypothetical protein ElyMa_003600700 [Elysia marginata]|uniref:Uncharacterized protein n=1 Tax=Elysia marginata TaxID=1093978 RepID=A0AAV4ER61_9GAST|nr:hypothetical protein ElyMa_003600700 [Elysia marginata]